MVQGRGFQIQMIYFGKNFFLPYIRDRFYITSFNNINIFIFREYKYCHNVILKCTEIRRIAQTNYATSVKQYLCRNRIGLP